MEETEKQEETKPNCHECKHRRASIASAHSSCYHPDLGDIVTAKGGNLLALLSHRVTATMSGDNPIGAKGSLRAIQNGWFNWPWDFDPTWLEECNGFEAREEPDDGDAPS